MLFLYVVDEAIYYLEPDAESHFHNFEELPTLDPELCFTFPTRSHPLNTKLAYFFRNECGFFHYAASTLYTKIPYQVISLDRYPALTDLAFRVETFQRFRELEIIDEDESETGEAK